jgi:hypothetical protein
MILSTVKSMNRVFLNYTQGVGQCSELLGEDGNLLDAFYNTGKIAAPLL